MHGYESVVGPVKGMYNQAVCNNKPRGHSLLTESRPNFITILALGTLLFHISFHRSWFLHQWPSSTIYYNCGVQPMRQFIIQKPNNIVWHARWYFLVCYHLKSLMSYKMLQVEESCPGFKLAILFATFTLLGFNWKAIYHFGWRLICRLHSRCVLASRTFSIQSCHLGS